MSKDPTDIRQPYEPKGITWKVVACAFAVVLWSIVFAMLTWLCSGVSTLKTDVAVIKNVLHIDAPVGATKSKHHLVTSND